MRDGRPLQDSLFETVRRVCHSWIVVDDDNARRAATGMRRLDSNDAPLAIRYFPSGDRARANRWWRVLARAVIGCVREILLIVVISVGIVCRRTGRRRW